MGIQIARKENFSARNSTRRWAGLAGALAGVAMFASPLQATEMGNWIGTWTASAQPVWGPDFPVPLSMPTSLWNQTIRQVARISVGGSRVRIVVSNEYGSMPLKVGEARVALAADDGKIQAGSDHTVTFGGSPSIVIPAGAPAISDPIDLAVTPLAKVSVSLFFPEVSPTPTMHWDGHQTAYVAAGDKVADATRSPTATARRSTAMTGGQMSSPSGSPKR